jgi:hypothetical protein
MLGELPETSLQVIGIRQLRLQLLKRAGEWVGCEALFYETPVNELRPFMRLLPPEGGGTPVSKVFVEGVLPIPALDDPSLLLQWAKETNPTEGADGMIVKYVHRAGSPSLYGTIRL